MILSGVVGTYLHIFWSERDKWSDCQKGIWERIRPCKPPKAQSLPLLEKSGLKLLPVAFQQTLMKKIVQKLFFRFLALVSRGRFAGMASPLWIALWTPKKDFEWFLCNFCFVKICTFPMTCTFSYIENILDLSAHFLMWKGQVSRFPLGHRGKEPSPQTSHGSAVPWIIQLLQLYQMQCMIFNISLAMCWFGFTDRLALTLRTLFLLALADVVPYNWVGSVRAGWRRTIRARWVPEDLIWFFNCFPTCSPRWGCSRPCPRWCSRGGWGRCTGASYSSPPLSGRQLLGIDIASP